MPTTSPGTAAAYGLALGSGTDRVEMGDTILWPYVVERVIGLGKPELVKGGRGRPREDGEYFGRDRLRGRLITLQGWINAESAGEARVLWRRLTTAWDVPDVRGVPGQCVPLELTLYGGDTVVVFGRPGKLDPTDDSDFETGCVNFTATFDCVDHLFYDALEQTVRVPLVAGAASGITWPTQWPLRWTSRTTSNRDDGRLAVGGTAGAWLQATIFAPGGIVRPVIEIEDVLTIELDLSLAASTPTRFVTVIASPWARSVLLDGVTDVAAALTPASGLLRYARIPPGPQRAILRGSDDTGTAWMNLSWRDAAQAI